MAQTKSGKQSVCASQRTTGILSNAWRSKRLLCVLLIAISAISSVGWYTTYIITHSIRNHIQDQLTSTLNTSILALETWEEFQRDTVASWAKEDRLRRAVMEQLAMVASDEATTEQLMTSPAITTMSDELEPVCQRHGFIGFVVVDHQGMNVASLLDKPVGQRTFYDRSDFVARALTGETLVSKPFPADVLLPNIHGRMLPDRPTMFAAAPIRDDQGKIVAALCFRIRPEINFTRILQMARFGNSGETYVFNRDGLMLSDSRFDDDLRTIGLLPEDSTQTAILNILVHDPGGNMLEGYTPQGSTRLTKMAASAVRGGSGVDIDGYRDYRGVPVLGAWQWLDRYDMGITTEVDLNEAYATLDRIKLAVYLVLGLLIVTALIVLWLEHLNTQRASLLHVSQGQLQIALRQVESQKYALDQHAIVAITDPSGKITYANDRFCQISGYTQQELIGEDHRLINSGYHTREFMADLWKTIQQGDVWQGEIKNLSKDGSEYWVESTIVPFTDGDGQITQYVAIRADITALKQAETDAEAARRRAEAADQSKSEFLANMSHEIRTPMTAILGYADLLLAPDLSASDLRNHVQTIRRNGEHLIGIINDILDLSKIEADKMTVEQIECSPHQLLADVESIMRVRADAKGLQFGVECLGLTPRTIQTDPTRVRQILINLVSNAIKFTESGGVRVTAKLGCDLARSKSCLRFEVIDSGIGMTQEQINHIFEPFAQADTSTTRLFGGTGLGLAITKRFTELLGGDIRVESTTGQGTSFIVTIATGPLDGVEMVEQSIDAIVFDTKDSHDPDDLPDDLPPLHEINILLAEDGPDNQRLIGFILKKWGATVTIVDNGKDALERALQAQQEGEPFHVILMDMQMPIMDGYTATRTLRERRYARPIVALTAHAMASDREKCLRAGCDEFTNKPINKTELLSILRQQAKSGQSHDEADYATANHT